MGPEVSFKDGAHAPRPTMKKPIHFSGYTRHAYPCSCVPWSVSIYLPSFTRVFVPDEQRQNVVVFDQHRALPLETNRHHFSIYPNLTGSPRVSLPAKTDVRLRSPESLPPSPSGAPSTPGPSSSPAPKENAKTTSPSSSTAATAPDRPPGTPRRPSPRPSASPPTARHRPPPLPRRYCRAPCFTDSITGRRAAGCWRPRTPGSRRS
mmetsp:Transcript_16616/g.37334  ORF Transcript_16616/g.37334 Transcript_16616/m.37334 type:complete len:206 (+) Transcript_16616:954-1571(+)